MEKRPAPKRAYPPAFERAFPWIIGIMFIGFLRAITPMGESMAVPAPVTAN